MAAVSIVLSGSPAASSAATTRALGRPLAEMDLVPEGRIGRGPLAIERNQFGLGTEAGIGQGQALDARFGRLPVGRLGKPTGAAA